MDKRNDNDANSQLGIPHKSNNGPSNKFSWGPIPADVLKIPLSALTSNKSSTEELNRKRKAKESAQVTGECEHTTKLFNVEESVLTPTGYFIDETVISESNWTDHSKQDSSPENTSCKKEASFTGRKELSPMEEERSFEMDTDIDINSLIASSSDLESELGDDT